MILSSLSVDRLTGPCVMLSLIASLLASSGCVSRVSNAIEPDAGLQQQAIELTETPLPLHVRFDLDRYLDATTPIFFLVANDGGHSLAWACRDDYCDYDEQVELRNAREVCEILRIGMGCTVLYWRKRPLASSIGFKENLTTRLIDMSPERPVDTTFGKIFYLPGFSGWSNQGYNFPPPLTDDSIPPVLEKLGERGWDVEILNILHLDRVLLTENPGLFGDLVAGLIADARAAGYPRVVLYGGSRGGVEIMQAVLHGADPDAIALMEPDWNGPKFSGRGALNEDHHNRSEDIRRMLASQTVDRIVFSFFKNSQWYIDISRAEIEASLTSLDVHYFLIAGPEHIEGHGGSWTYRFANTYAQCLHDFFIADIDSGLACKTPVLDNTDRRNWATQHWISGGEFGRLSGRELLDLLHGRALCSYDVARDEVAEISCMIWTETERYLGFINEFGQLGVSRDIIDLNNDGFCRHNGLYFPTYGCAAIYRVAEDLLVFAPANSNRIAWYRIVPPEAIKDRFQQASILCGSRSKLAETTCRLRENESHPEFD